MAEVRKTYQHTYDEFDLAGNLIHSTLINQAAVETSYDLLSRPTHISTPLFKESQVEFDAVGNLMRRSSIDPIGKIDHEYQYDELDQLIENSGHYSYDSLANP